jgi:hypothetical protein
MVCGEKKAVHRLGFSSFSDFCFFCFLESHYNVSSFVNFLCCFCLHITEYEQIRGGGAKLSRAQVCKIPKYGPLYTLVDN